MNSAWPLWPSSGSTVALTTCTSAMPAVADPDLVPVEHPVVAVAPRRRAQVAHVRAALRLGDRQRRELQRARHAEALGRPAQQLRGRRGLRDRAQRQRRHHDAQPDPGAAPEQLLHEQRQREARRVADQVAVEERVVEALARGLLEDLPRELLLAVVVVGRGTDHVARERVRALDEVLLRRREGEREGHRSTIATTPWPPAAQIEISARPEPRSASSFAAVGEDPRARSRRTGARPPATSRRR